MEASKAAQTQARQALSRDRLRRADRHRRTVRRERNVTLFGAVDSVETCVRCGASDDLGAMLRAEDGAVCSPCHVVADAAAIERSDRRSLGGLVTLGVLAVQSLLPAWLVWMFIHADTLLRHDVFLADRLCAASLALLVFAQGTLFVAASLRRTRLQSALGDPVGALSTFVNGGGIALTLFQIVLVVAALLA